MHVELISRSIVKDIIAEELSPRVNHIYKELNLLRKKIRELEETDKALLVRLNNEGH